jgi:hypothetical protein
VIRCRGGNNYVEGAADSTRDWKALKRMDRYRRQVIAYMRQQVLLGLNRVDPTEPLLSEPKLPELPERMKIGPQLPHDLVDLEPLHSNHDPKQRRRRRAKWDLLQPPAQSKPPSDKPPLKPLPPVEPPPPPQPRELQNRPNTKGRNTKKATFKVSFVEPQIGQRQEQQRQEQRAPDGQED